MLNFTEDKLSGKLCFDILNRLIERKLFKRIFKINIRELPDECIDPLSRITDPSQKNERETLEKLIAEKIFCKINQDIRSEFVILHKYKIKSLYDRDEEILVETRTDPIYFGEQSYIFKSISKNLNELFVEIYAPLEYKTPQKRNEIIRIINEPIKQLFKDYYSNKGDNQNGSS